MRQPVTIKDIARHLGISYATVSLALNDAPGVNEETRNRVKEYARRVRYRPNASARAISTGRSRLVATVLNRLTDSFFEEIVQGIENVAYRRGYDVIVNTANLYGGQDDEFVERLIARHIDGLVSASFALSAAQAQRLADVGVPILLLSPEPIEAHPYVAVDHELGGRLGAAHLAELGHRDLLFLGDEAIYSVLRARGAEAVMAETGGRVRVCRTPHAIDAAAAYDSVRPLLTDDRAFTAIFCADDVLAIGACRAVLDAGLRVPEDVSVVGFDDLRWTRLLSPPLTTIHQPQISQGETAMEMLVEMMEGRPVEGQVLRPRLVVRDSTGPAPLQAVAAAGPTGHTDGGLT